jgi:hypothetical protein
MPSNRLNTEPSTARLTLALGGERTIVLHKGLVGTYVDIERHSLGDSELSGFVLDVSEDLALIHYLSDDFHLDGYCVIRNSDVTACNIFDDPKCFKHRALRVKTVRPKKPRGLNISNWATALESAGTHYPLLVLYREEIAADICVVGSFVELNSLSVTLYSITPTAEWDRKTQLLVVDTTRLDFGGGYEDALWKVASESGSVPE